MPLSTLIIIPAYNAAVTIDRLIERLSEHVDRRNVLVVDDGASDGTGDLAREAGVHVISHDSNRGKGAALKTGFQHAIANGYDAVITLDADLQHDPNLVPRFMELSAKGDHDIIIGTRSRTSDMPIHRVFANFTSSVVVSIFSKTLIRDSQSGFRWIRTEALKNLQLRGEKYDLESELLIRIGRKGRSIGELPISTIYGESASFINPLVDTARIIRLLWSSLFW